MLLALATTAAAADEPPEAWSREVPAFQIGARTWYVGSAGLSALLVKTGQGAVLIDSGLPQSAQPVLARLDRLGVPRDRLRLILFSHAHFDHAGAVAEIARATGATVVANAEGQALLARGGSDDLHFGYRFVFPPATTGRLVQDGEAVELGGVYFTAHFTPGHTPGSLSWHWRDTVAGREVDIVYADSLSAPDYRLIDNPRYPKIVDAYRRSFAALRALPCELLITPHPEMSGLDPVKPQPAAARLDKNACRAYADAAEKKLDAQLSAERGRTGDAAR